jgi:TatD DNase family protein
VDFVDTHCHLNYGSLQDEVDLVLQRAFNNRVTRIMVPGTDLVTSRQAIQLAEKFPQVFAAVGIHPNDGLKWTDDSAKELNEMLQHPRVLAVGEIGLDYYRLYAPQAIQVDILRQQLALAAHHNKPVIIHCRLAMEDLWPIMKKWQESLTTSLKNHPGVFHSFDSDLIIASEIIDHSFFIGVSGPVTYKNATDRHKTISSLPLEKLVLETDAPFLSPHPLRGRINEPANIPIIAEKVAQLLNCSVEKVAQITSGNAQKIFEWIG